MGMIGRYMQGQREKIARNEAMQRIRIQDWGDEIVFTVDGIKVGVISGDLERDAERLRNMREDYVKGARKY